MLLFLLEAEKDKLGARLARVVGLDELRLGLREGGIADDVTDVIVGGVGELAMVVGKGGEVVEKEEGGRGVLDRVGKEFMVGAEPAEAI